MGENVANQPLTASPAAIEECAKEIFKLGRAKTIELTVAVGKLIVDFFYEGKLELWAGYNRGDLSIARLAEKLAAKDPDWTQGRLYACVRLYEQSVQLGGFERWPELSPSHLAVVQGLLNDAQVGLLDEAQQLSLTVEEFRARVAVSHRNKPDREPEVNAASQASRLLRAVAKAVEPRALLVQGCKEAGLPPEELNTFDRLLGDLERESARIAELLGRTRKASSTARASLEG